MWITFKPVFDLKGALTIGDIAVSISNPDLVYLGTGEKNASRSSYAGSGMYLSKNRGKSWKKAVLEGSQYISRLIVNPVKSEVVYTVVIGNLYS